MVMFDVGKEWSVCGWFGRTMYIYYRIKSEIIFKLNILLGDFISDANIWLDKSDD